MKFLKIAGLALAGLLGLLIVAGVVARLVINGPIGPLAGGKLDGPESPAPADWTFTDDHFTIAIEVRPDDPHSVTVVCFVSDGELYIPARDAANKSWPNIALEDGRARVRVGDDVYRVSLVRVVDDGELAVAGASAAKKYAQLAEGSGDGIPEGVWLFRAERRS